MDKNNTLLVHGKPFQPKITAAEIASTIEKLGKEITADYQGKKPIFLAILNGSFIFSADLVRACALECEISFVKLASYEGLESSGKVKTLIGLDIDVKDRHIIIVEDIVDTGKTLYEFIPQLQEKEPASIAIASLLVKPKALQYPLEVKYHCFQIPPDFVIGFGLDYDGLARNLPDIYEIIP